MNGFIDSNTYYFFRGVKDSLVKLDKNGTIKTTRKRIENVAAKTSQLPIINHHVAKCGRAWLLCTVNKIWLIIGSCVLRSKLRWGLKS